MLIINEMSKIKIILLGSLIVISLVLITQHVKAQTTQLKTYTDPEGFYTLQYPSNWTTKYQPSVSKFDGPVTFFYLDGNRSAYVSIDVERSPGTQKQYEDVFNQSVGISSNRGRDVTKSEFGLYKIDGQNAGAIQSQTLQEKSITVASVFNGKLIVVGFTTLKRDYDSQIPQVEKVIDSIKITGT